MSVGWSVGRSGNAFVRRSTRRTYWPTWPYFFPENAAITQAATHLSVWQTQRNSQTRYRSVNNPRHRKIGASVKVCTCFHVCVHVLLCTFFAIWDEMSLPPAFLGLPLWKHAFRLLLCNSGYILFKCLGVSILSVFISEPSIHVTHSFWAKAIPLERVFVETKIFGFREYFRTAMTS